MTPNVSDLVREVRARDYNIPGVVSITSARAPDSGGFRTAAVSVNGEPPSPQNTQAILYYTYIVAELLSDAEHSPRFRTRIRSASRPASECRRPQRICRAIAVARTESDWPQPAHDAGGQFHTKDDADLSGPAYEVIGVARDTRGFLLNGSDSEQIYLPMPENRLQDFTILIRTQAAPTQIVNAIGPIILSIDPNLVAYTLTLELMLRTTESFFASSISAVIASEHRSARAPAAFDGHL